MTKFPKRQFQSTRRCTSSGRHATYELLRGKTKKKSASNGPSAGRAKKKFIRRVVLRGAAMDTEDLLERIEPFANVEKRPVDDVLERSEESIEIDGEAMFGSPTNRFQRPRMHARSKINGSTVKSLNYKSKRHQIVTPCFDEEVIINTPPELRHMYHQGVKEEDCDSTDSIIQMGIEKGMKHLLAGVNSPGIKSKVMAQRNSRIEDTFGEDEARDYPLRYRTRMNSPHRNSQMVDSRGSKYCSSRNIPYDKD